jgi:hypothetical protein
MVGQIAWENGIDVNDGADGGDDAEEEDCASDLKKGKRQGTIQRRRLINALIRIAVPGVYHRFIGKREMTGLLELAGANTNPQSRRDLVNVLKLAQMAWEDEKNTSSRRRLSPKQIQQLEASIEKTRMLLTQIREYDDFRNIGFVTQQIGRGVVAPPAQGLPRNPSISDEELILPHCDGPVVAISILSHCYAPLRSTREGDAEAVGGRRIWKKKPLYFTQSNFSVGIPPKSRALLPKIPSMNLQSAFIRW